MHSVLPHEHHSSISQEEHSEEHESADSVLDFIKLVFHNDMGDGHLENIQVSYDGGIVTNLVSQPIAPFSLLVDLVQINDSAKAFVKKTIPTENLSCYLTKQYKTNIVRGPPSIS